MMIRKYTSVLHTSSAKNQIASGADLMGESSSALELLVVVIPYCHSSSSSESLRSDALIVRRVDR